MPRSCSSSDMAGTAMLYRSGTDGAAVTDVRLHGSRSTQHPESRNTRNALEPEFHAVPAAPGQLLRPTPPHMAVGALLRSSAESACQSWMATTPGSTRASPEKNRDTARVLGMLDSGNQIGIDKPYIVTGAIIDKCDISIVRRQGAEC